MMHKRVWLLSLVVAFALLLAACGGGGGGQSSTGDGGRATPAATDTAQTGGAPPPSDDPYTISGIVTDPDGTPLPGVEFFIRPHLFETDENGRFSVSDLTDENTFMPYHPDYEFEETTVAGPTSDLHIIGTPLGCLPLSPCKISDAQGLQDIREDLSGHYVLVSDIDASETKDWNDGLGFEPIARSTWERFEGRLDGQGFKIIGLHVDRPDEDDIALFAFVHQDAEIRNLGLVDGRVAGRNRVASLAAQSKGTIENVFNDNDVEAYDRFSGGVGGIIATLEEDGVLRDSYNSGTVKSAQFTAGGLVASNRGGTIEHSYNTGTVFAVSDGAGGIASENTRGGTILHSYNAGPVSGHASVGGVVGSNDNTSHIGHSYNTGSVTGGNWDVGGVAGKNAGAIEFAANHGDVATEYQQAGGIVGSNTGTIAYSYNTGNISAAQGQAGGIAGTNGSPFSSDDLAPISHSYSSGEVRGTSAVGGVVGLLRNNGAVDHSFSTSAVVVIDGHWDTPRAGGLIGHLEEDRRNPFQGDIVASFYVADYFKEGPDRTIHTELGVAKTDDELKDEATFMDASWDFGAVWTIDDGSDFPDLRENPRP